MREHFSYSASRHSESRKPHSLRVSFSPTTSILSNPPQHQMSDSLGQGGFAAGYAAGFLAAYEAGRAAGVLAAESCGLEKALPASQAAGNHSSRGLPSKSATFEHQGSAPRSGSTWEPDAIELIVNVYEHATKGNDEEIVCEMLAFVIQHLFQSRDWAPKPAAESVSSTYNALSAAQKASFRLKSDVIDIFLKTFCID